MIFSLGTLYSRGVAIDFPTNGDYSILEKYNNNNERFVLLKWKCEEATYVIANCYAPTQQYKKDQINFINFDKSYINNFENENIIMGGDCNFYMDLELDRQKNMTSNDNNQPNNYSNDIA